MIISNVDKKVSTAWEKLRIRREKNIVFEEKEKNRVECERIHTVTSKEAFLQEALSVPNEEETDTDFVIPENKNTTEQNQMSLKNFVTELDRYQISDGAGAALATALLEDLGYCHCNG